MNITIEYSTNTLLDDAVYATGNVDDVASILSFEEMAQIEIREEFPAVEEIEIYSGKEDRCLCEGEDRLGAFEVWEEQIADLIGRIRRERKWVVCKES